jgi:hypothetical protein
VEAWWRAMSHGRVEAVRSGSAVEDGEDLRRGGGE